MKATGIVVEYNPFHNGHLYHAQQSKLVTNADVLIAVMSGNFLQRGEPAFVDKWARTKMALQNGVDIVFELPYAFATAHAPTFASGAIQLLDAACCDAFCFGSEDGSIAPLQRSLDLIQQEEVRYNDFIKEAVDRGLSYPKALNEAYVEISRTVAPNEKLADLSKPNNILGFHYMEEARKIQSEMEPKTIPRVVAHYYDDVVEGNKIASATGIRKSFFSANTIDSVHSFIPKETFETLSDWQTKRQSFGNWESFYPLLRFTILREGPERLSKIADVTEGIEHLFYKAARNSETFESFMEEVKSKRYSWTRIQRMLTHIFTGFTYEIRNTISSPTYLRLLGMNQTGRRFLNVNKKRLKLPLISKAASFSNSSFQFDIHASDMYALGIGNDSTIGIDFTQPPIVENHFTSNVAK